MPNVPTWHAPPLAQSPFDQQAPYPQAAYPQAPYPQAPYGQVPYDQQALYAASQASAGWPYAAPPVVQGLGHPGKRLLARIIDWLIVFPCLGALMAGVVSVAVPENGSGGSGDPPGWVVAVIVLGIFGAVYLYEATQLALWGATLGKRVMKLRVVRADALNGRLSTGHAFGRAACYPLLFSVIGAVPLVGLVNTLNVLWQLWDRPLRQCLHDKMAKTAVVDTRVFSAS